MEYSKRKLINLLFYGLVFFHLGSYLGRWFWIFDLVSNFRIQILYTLLAFFCIHIYFRQKVLASINLILILSIVLSLIPYFRPIKKTSVQTESIKICSSNLELINNQIEAVEMLIQKENPDILLLMEVTHNWQNLLNLNVSKSYPYQIWEPMEGYFGIAFLSKFPINQSKIIYSSQFKLPNILAEIDYNGKPLAFLGIHPPPPINIAHFRMRNQQYRQINQQLKTLETPVILLGDFNSTKHSNALNILLDNTKLRDSRLGKGLQPTWSISNQIPPFLALDHLFVSPEINVLKRYVGRSINSDHLPILIEVVLE
jgi:endonuclease/exonuclease/phosphatase (EEP) superfamily protein YafD